MTENDPGDRAELISEKKPPPDDKAQPPRPPMKYTNIIQWVTSNEKCANPGQKSKIWMIGTQEVSKTHSDGISHFIGI